MHMDGISILQPTALVIKLSPSAVATANFSQYPQELSITLRHIPQPEQFSKSTNRSGYNTYYAFLINTRYSSKTFLGSINKYRPGTYQLFAENIPTGEWDQLVVSLSSGGSAELGYPLFEISDDFSVSSSKPDVFDSNRFTTLPADATLQNISCKAAPISAPRPEKNSNFNANFAHPCNVRSPGTWDSPTTPDPFDINEPSILQPGMVLSEEDNEDTLLQPGTVLPEGDFLTPSNTAKLFNPQMISSDQQMAKMDGPNFFDLRPPSTNGTGQISINPFTVPQLKNHMLWLVDYQGFQLVGYVYDSSDPQKQLYIVHGVPGAYQSKDKPSEIGYEYWLANPQGEGGYWLRYVNPQDNTLGYPYPIPGK
jgi:hypothetical protein